MVDPPPFPGIYFPGAVPDPAGLAMMIVGFDAVGMTLRRGKKSDSTNSIG